MPSFTREMFDRLVTPGPRLPWLREWLLGQVWTRERYEDLNPVQFLEKGEREVNELEEVLVVAASRVYDELLADPPPSRDVRRFLQDEHPCAVIVFDGLSLREVPAILRLAERTNLAVREVDVGVAAVPTETVEFIEQRLRVGRLAPSQLSGRRELREAGIAAYYYDHPGRRYPLDPEAPAFLLWSAFPDQTYQDSGARFAQHFEQIHTLLETAWMNTVQQVKEKRQILITSDHGYCYFGAGCSFPRSPATLRPLSAWLGGERWRRLEPGGEEPPKHPDLAILSHRGVATIRGRVQTHPPGPTSSRLYKHGGLSLMEMLTPWIVLESTRRAV